MRRRPPGAAACAARAPKHPRMPSGLATELLRPPCLAPLQTINDWYDRDIDAINEPYRPIPSGAAPALPRVRRGGVAGCIWQSGQPSNCRRGWVLCMRLQDLAPLAAGAPPGPRLPPSHESTAPLPLDLQAASARGR